MKADGIYNKYIKRGLDIVISGCGLIVLSPVYAGLALAVRSKLGSPVIFSQERPGLIDPKTGQERIFKLYKFRSMTDARGADGELLPDEDRLPPFGAKLRSTSLDELPELWNIFKGDMSIVGPRPLLVRYLPRYSPEQRRRHLVRPGLTGLAQVNGRNAISWDDKFAYDVEYVDNVSLALDVKIFFKTVAAVLRHEGISSDTSVTMEEFMGNEND
jgi:lipopolysaccharide/colanic/teichoic acid biosynthesis glycosyltransferase